MAPHSLIDLRIGPTPRSRTAKNGHKTVVELLLATKGYGVWTPLSWLVPGTTRAFAYRTLVVLGELAKLQDPRASCINSGPEPGPSRLEGQVTEVSFIPRLPIQISGDSVPKWS